MGNGRIAPHASALVARCEACPHPARLLQQVSVTASRYAHLPALLLEPPLPALLGRVLVVAVAPPPSCPLSSRRAMPPAAATAAAASRGTVALPRFRSVLLAMVGGGVRRPASMTAGAADTRVAGGCDGGLVLINTTCVEQTPRRGAFQIEHHCGRAAGASPTRAAPRRGAIARHFHLA